MLRYYGEGGIIRMCVDGVRLEMGEVREGIPHGDPVSIEKYKSGTDCPRSIQLIPSLVSTLPFWPAECDAL